MSASSVRRVRVLVVEDSPVMRDLLVHVLGQAVGLEVVGSARDGVEAIEQTHRLRPDVVTMDIHMPRMDGLAATRSIMEQTPTPIVVVSSSSACSEVAATFRILEAGAVAMVAKPRGMTGGEIAKLIEIIRLMAEVKVVRRWPRVLGNAPGARTGAFAQSAGALRVVAIGASTGGPVVLRNILARLGSDFPVPLVITQHISPGFIEGFVRWLGQSSGFPVALANQHEALVAGRAYVAPDGAHLNVAPHGSGCRALLNTQAHENGHRPAVSQLFRSVADGFGADAVGVLLSGMGRDGADELKLMRQRGALTIAQQLDSAVVPGMPRVAIELGAAARILAPQEIALALRQAAGCAATGRERVAGST